jgi:hypothetical protein
VCHLISSLTESQFQQAEDAVLQGCSEKKKKVLFDFDSSDCMQIIEQLNAHCENKQL